MSKLFVSVFERKQYVQFKTKDGILVCRSSDPSTPVNPANPANPAKPSNPSNNIIIVVCWERTPQSYVIHALLRAAQYWVDNHPTFVNISFNGTTRQGIFLADQLNSPLRYITRSRSFMQKVPNVVVVLEQIKNKNHTLFHRLDKSVWKVILSYGYPPKMYDMIVLDIVGQGILLDKSDRVDIVFNGSINLELITCFFKDNLAIMPHINHLGLLNKLSWEFQHDKLARLGSDLHYMESITHIKDRYEKIVVRYINEVINTTAQ